MGQLTFAELEYDRKKRRTRRELFPGADGAADPLGTTWKIGSSRSIRRPAAVGSRTRWA